MKLKMLLMALVVMLLALPAQAHNFTGTGDCDSWNLVLDGTWGATEIFVDGVSVGLNLTPEIADFSPASSRSFVVLWDKTSGDVTVTHTLNRVLENCQQPTTTTTAPIVTTTTTEVVPTTTTTVPATSTTGPSPTTTITIAPTTTDTAVVVPTVVSAPIVTVDTGASSQEKELPFTGFDPALLVALGASLAFVGAWLLRVTRKPD